MAAAEVEAEVLVVAVESYQISCVPFVSATCIVMDPGAWVRSEEQTIG